MKEFHKLRAVKSKMRIAWMKRDEASDTLYIYKWLTEQVKQTGARGEKQWETEKGRTYLDCSMRQMLRKSGTCKYK